MPDGVEALLMVPLTFTGSGWMTPVPREGLLGWQEVPVTVQAGLTMALVTDGSQVRALPAQDIHFPIGRTPRLYEAFAQSAYRMDRWEDIAALVELTLGECLQEADTPGPVSFVGLDLFDISRPEGTVQKAPFMPPRSGRKGVSFSVWI